MINGASLKDYCLESCRKHRELLSKAIYSVPLGGVLPSEMLLFMAVAIEQEVDWIVESGRKEAYSTEVFVRAARWSVYSVDTHPIAAVDGRLLRDYPERLTLAAGDGRRVVKNVLREGSHHPRRRAAVLLDGPKNLTAVEMLPAIEQDCVFVGVHDVCRLGGGESGSEPNPGRAAAEKLEAFFTDDPDFTAEFGEMDEPAWRMGGYSSREELIGRSCVLGLFPGGKWRDG